MSSRTRRVDALRNAASALAPDVALLAARIAEIPAPTGCEAARAAFVARLFAERGYEPTHDAAGNVYIHRGARGGRCVMLAAHLDTVFPPEVPVSIAIAADRLSGPGVGDNSLGIAAVVGLFDVLDRVDAPTAFDLVATATVGEEGLGNLAGARAALDRYEHVVAAFIAVEGHNLGRVTCTGVGSARWRVTVRGPGGHSWGAYGQPSAIHGLAAIIAEASRLRPPVQPKTTFNVGVIEGGLSVNTIAPEASALVDIRSICPDALGAFCKRVRSTMQIALPPGLELEIDVLGERPAGSTRQDHPLVQSAAAALRELGRTPIFDASSTDANVAMERGIPAICIGISRGGGGHTIDEFIETSPIASGLTQLALIVTDPSIAPAGERP